MNTANKTARPIILATSTRSVQFHPAPDGRTVLVVYRETGRGGRAMRWGVRVVMGVERARGEYRRLRDQLGYVVW